MCNNKNFIILFDGVCNLCNYTVRFVIKNDKNNKFKFTSLQSEFGQSLLQKMKLPMDNFDSLVLIMNEKYYLKSSAVLHILKELSGLFKLLYIFKIIPKPLCDFFYDIIAKSRFKFFRKRHRCIVSSFDFKSRFIE